MAFFGLNWAKMPPNTEYPRRPAAIPKRTRQGKLVDGVGVAVKVLVIPCLILLATAAAAAAKAKGNHHCCKRRVLMAAPFVTMPLLKGSLSKGAAVTDNACRRQVRQASCTCSCIRTQAKDRTSDKLKQHAYVHETVLECT